MNWVYIAGALLIIGIAFMAIVIIDTKAESDKLKKQVDKLEKNQRKHREDFLLHTQEYGEYKMYVDGVMIRKADEDLSSFQPFLEDGQLKHKEPPTWG